ncbi:Vesicle trafficking between the ER and Golgi [Blyttiomyces sp. JEL0837]|nr:Vesicle trafficking between the ER and Golgi [Blyttiomyces sp. JEL0837]
MLNLNQKDNEVDALGGSTDSPRMDGSSNVLANSTADPVWKVLVYDQAGQEIISPLMKVNELRENGVTVHMHLASDRQPIPDVPAIYFVHPTTENIKRICDDLSRKLYDSYFINFISAIPRPLLEELAASTIASNSYSQVAQLDLTSKSPKIYDQYLNYVCLEDKLFTLNLGDTYKILNDPISSDSAIDQLTSRIVDSLFSLLATMGTVPIIRAPRGNAAASVAAKLDQRLREHLMNVRNNLFPDSASMSSVMRPVLIILDRNLDLSTILSHTWTYSPLVHDLLDLKLNRVVVPMEEKGVKSKKVYDIDQTDFFWQKNGGNPFPQVAEDVSAEINKYKKDVEEVTKSSGVSSLAEVDPTTNAANLKHAINILPQLTERKRTLDMHMNIATHLFKIIGDRQLDTFFQIEEAISKQTKATILEMLKDPKKDAEDKLRLFLIYYLSVDDIPKEEIAQFEEALVAAGATTTSINYVKSVRTFTRIAAASSASQQQSTSSDLFGKFTSISSKIAGHLEGTGGFENLISGVRNLLPARKDLPVTKVVDAIMEGSNNSDVDDYLYLDPKLGRNASVKQPKSKSIHQEAIVFVIGGGNYLEYQNLQDLAQRAVQKKKIAYGATEILTAKAFLKQLEALGGR